MRRSFARVTPGAAVVALEDLVCPILCDADCEADCHEEHTPGFKRDWDHFDNCSGRTS